MDGKNIYLDIFTVTEPQLQTLTATALAHGGDYCDLYFEHTTFFNLLLTAVGSGGRGDFRLIHSFLHFRHRMQIYCL